MSFVAVPPLERNWMYISNLTATMPLAFDKRLPAHIVFLVKPFTLAIYRQARTVDESLIRCMRMLRR